MLTAIRLLQTHHERQKQPYGRQHTYHHYRTQRPAYEKTESLPDRKSGSAGMPRPISYAVFCLKKKIEKLIAINVRGLFVATQEAARHLREGGRIIHIGSTNSERMPFVGGSVYALTKGAVAGFTKGLARDLGPRGITVNNVQPGPIDTDINPADSDFAKTLVPMTALQRYGNTDEIASFVAYLASPEASYITGASLLADGGFAA